MNTVIKGAPFPVRIDGTSLLVQSSGCKGVIKIVDPLASNRAVLRKVPLASAASEAEIKVIVHLEMELSPAVSQASGSRSARAIAPELIVPVSAGNNYAILCTDDSSQSIWLFPKSVSAQQARFSLPLSETISGAGTRGIVTKTMRSLVSVVSWVVAPALGSVAREVIASWEARKRPYGLHLVSKDGTLSEPKWDTFTPGPLLLLIHGTFSTPQVGFDGWLGSPAFHVLVERYAGRVLAFAHPSLSVDPQENIDWLLEQLPEQIVAGAILDIVSHSRGGLVARELVRRGNAAPKIARVCLVGTPNLGTPLADILHWTTFLNVHTSLLSVLPDSTTTVLMEGLLCLVKILGSGLTGGLPGLAAMDPGSQWLRESASDSGPAAWYTIGASYQPESSGVSMLGRFNKQIIQEFFASSNDLVVPTEGCHQSIQPPSDSFRLEGSRFNHCNYFESEEVQSRLALWLS